MDSLVLNHRIVHRYTNCAVRAVATTKYGYSKNYELVGSAAVVRGVLGIIRTLAQSQGIDGDYREMQYKIGAYPTVE